MANRHLTAGAGQQLAGEARVGFHALIQRGYGDIKDDRMDRLPACGWRMFRRGPAKTGLQPVTNPVIQPRSDRPSTVPRLCAA